MIPYGRQDIHDSDIAAILDVLQSDFLTQGPAVPRFEQIVSKHCGARHAVAVNSATSALHIALMALDVRSGDVVWTSPNTFVASANVALYCRASVDFVDIDPVTYNMSVSALSEKLANAKKIGRLPKVVIPVHFTGEPCDMAQIHHLAQQYGFKVVEDASHAIGGRYQNQPIGNCAYSDVTVFSFHPVKIITTAEGGMALTNDHTLAEKMALYRSHGITRDPALMTHTSDGPWYYQQIALGFNYRMTDLQAALGTSQMQRLDSYVARRQELAQRYDAMLSEFPLETPWRDPKNYSAFHLYIIRLKLDEIAKSRGEVFEAMRKKGIGVNVHYIPVHTQPYYAAMGFNYGDFPNAERFYSEVLSIPLFATLTNDEQYIVVKAIRETLS
jgi:UDP-4-amino-4,6-dideoxy-N-acetyl-beta-L-altrosamine transaminase